MSEMHARENMAESTLAILIHIRDSCFLTRCDRSKPNYWEYQAVLSTLGAFKRHLNLGSPRISLPIIVAGTTFLLDPYFLALSPLSNTAR